MKINFNIKLFVCFLLMLQTFSLYAQDVTVKGVVKDEKGEVLSGAYINVQGTKIFASTDIDGKYTIKAPAKGTLVFSFLGFVPTKVQLKGKSELNVTLVENTNTLGAVVVQGYGPTRKVDATGSFGSVSAEVLDKSISTTADQAIQGRIAGVNVVQNSGVPGGGTSIQIRGVNSINSTNEPIYVVDGVIIAPQTGSITNNPLSGINTSDIESIDVLKDASAAAIYGAQGANGVIIITMKKGKTLTPTISFSSNFGVQQLKNEVSMMNLQQYADHYNYMIINGFGNGLNARDDFSNPSTLGLGTNWQRVIFRDAYMKNYNLSVRGTNKGTVYSVSGGYFDQDGIAVTSDFKRTTFRADVESQANSWLKLSSSINLNYNTQNTGIASWSTVPYALYSQPKIPVYNADGSYGGATTDQEYSMTYGNPLAAANLTKRSNTKFGSRGNTFLLFTPVKWMNFKTEVSGEVGTDNYSYFLPSYKAGNYVVNATTQNEHSNTTSFNWTWRNLLNFDYKFKNNHKVTALLGHEVSSYSTDYLQGKRLNGSTVLDGLDAGDSNFDENSGYSTRRTLVSLFGRMFYSYKDKYQLTATLRNDGSSNFLQGHQWGLFPSAAIGWRVSEEKFFNPLKNVVDNLKFRLSYGKVGNSNVGAFAYQSMLSNVQSNWGVSLKTANIANPDLVWETTNSWNAGFDLNLLKSRIELIFDAYVKNTDNLLLQAQLPSYLGTNGTGNATAPWINVGSIENKGFEFAINTINVSNSKFKWKSSLTFSTVQNKITKMNSEDAKIDKSYAVTNVYSDIITRTTVGQPISQFYGYVVSGRINSAADFLKDNGDGTSTVTVATRTYRKGDVINNTNYQIGSAFVGDLLFKDLNNDGVIDTKDKTFIGNPLPKFTTGFTNSFTYKYFDLSVFLYCSYGNKVLNLYRPKIDDPTQVSGLSIRASNFAKLGYLDGNSSNKNIWNYYVLPGADPSEVRMEIGHTNVNHAISTRFVEDGSFIRIQNISFGFTLPEKKTKVIGLKKVRLYTNIQNLITFSNYSGFDPEVGSTQGQYSTSGQGMLMYGVDASRIPSPRIISFGIDLTL